MLGREGTTDGAAALLTQAAREFERVTVSLKAQLERRPPASAA